MTAELIYKTNSPAALAWWEDAKKVAELSNGKRTAYGDQMAGEFGVTPQSNEYVKPYTERALMVRNNRVVGLASGLSEKPPADSGWRLDSKFRFWKPALKTPKGKQRQRELDALVTFDHYNHLHEIGVPNLLIAGNHLMHAGIEEGEGFLWQTWGSGTAAAQCVVEQKNTPEVTWTEVLRSEWYARIEAKDDGR